MQEYRVSVVITSYNQEDYLREAIESVINQSARPHEIIVADDCSTRDGSVELIRDYEKRYPGWVRGVLNKQNIGIPENRNSGLQIVTGTHLTVLDGDDRLLPDFIETLTNVLAAHPEAQCAYANRYQMTSEGERVRIRDTEIEPSGDLFTYIATGRVGILRTLIAPFPLVRQAGMFDKGFFHQDGYILTLRLAKLAKFIYVSEPLMEKRTHPGGTSKTIAPNERISCYEDIVVEVVKQSAHLPKTERDWIEKIWLDRIAKLKRKAS